jgi:hypothetical protein
VFSEDALGCLFAFAWSPCVSAEEAAPALAVSADAVGAMRPVRPCGSERAAARIGGAVAEVGVEVEEGTGLGLGLGLGLRLSFVVGFGVGRCLGGGGRGGEQRRGGESGTSERREPSESESAAWSEEYIAGRGGAMAELVVRGGRSGGEQS